MNILSELKDNAFDLGIVDPPYGINAPKMSMGTNLTRTGDGYPSISTAGRLRKGRLNSGGGKLKNTALQSMPIEWDYETPSPEYFKQLFRVCRNVIIWGGNYFDLPPSRCIVCWDKMQPWENFSQFEMAWTSFDKPAALFRYSNTGGVNREKKIHPTQKPVKLYEWLLTKFAKPGDTFDRATHRMRQSWEAGFMPFAMLYRDDKGDYSRDWKQFQGQWANPIITACNLKKYFGE